MRRQQRKQECATKFWDQIARMRMPLMVVCILAFGASMIYAKYIQTSQYNDAITAREFYFSSDVLDGGVHEIPALDEDGTATLTFHLMNHEDQLRYLDVPITYEVTWEEEQKNTAETDHVESANGNEAGRLLQGTNLSEKIAAGEGKNGQTNDKTVTISGLEQGKTYTVTATATAPYTKTLSAIIRVQQKNEELQATVTDHGNYIEVTVWTADKAKKIRLINQAVGVIPDNTDSSMKDMLTVTDTSGESQSDLIDLKSNASHVFRFFKSDAEKNYKATVTTVTDHAEIDNTVTVEEVTNE